MIKYGEYGQNFFITLHGEVGVLIPSAKKKTPLPKKMSVAQEHSDSEDNKSQREDTRAHEIRRMTRRFTKFANKKVSMNEPQPVLVKISSNNLMPGPIDEETDEEENYTEVATLKGGSSFGELALISSKPRAATIRAKTRSYFAVLGKADYQKVLLKIQEKELNKKIDFFKSLPIFQDWTRISVGKITYFFIEKHLKRNFRVYSEGDPTDSIYIVIDGEFEANKTVTIGKKKSPDEKFIHEHINDKKQKKPISRVQKEMIQSYAQSLSNSSSEASLDRKSQTPMKDRGGTENVQCLEHF